ncbi:MAG: hypothetical protein ACQES8_08530 [Thermodesulfobacteriota bacterium]
MRQTVNGLSLCLIFFFLLELDVQAHGVRVFAWSAGETIKVEAAFRGSGPARKAKITVQEAESGHELVSGLTDSKGLFQFPVPPQAIREKMDLKITADCGPGHKGKWLLKAADYLEMSAHSPPLPAATGGEQEKEVDGGGKEAAGPEIDEHLIRTIVAEELDKKLAPLKKLLHESLRPKIDSRDVIGGIGWLLGLAGIAAWIKNKKKE